jgi:hypothetical protein
MAHERVEPVVHGVQLGHQVGAARTSRRSYRRMASRRGAWSQSLSANGGTLV